MLRDGLGDHVIGAPRIGQALRLNAAGRDRDDRLVDACRVHLRQPGFRILADAVGHRAPDMRVHVDDLPASHACASSSVSLRPALPDL